MPYDDVAISVRNLTKTYRLFGHPGDRIKQFLALGVKQFHREFTALKDVSFDIQKGEAVGIIGRNGAGKSTLLQLICGILKPTAGSVWVKGKVSALLELGAGFNAEFTGRENVYFQGAVMGISRREMEDRFDEIAAFADIGQFIEQPVRMYSSGMFLRLAFAVAIHVDPEVLVVDEALAVGDAVFQAKCFQRMSAIRSNGGSILLVTHSAEQVAHFCDRALLLDDGKLLADGGTSETLALYVNRLRNRPTVGDVTEGTGRWNADDGFILNPAYNQHETRWGDRAASIEDVSIAQQGQENPTALVPGITTQLMLHVRFHADIERPIYGLSIKTAQGAMLFTTNTQQLLAMQGPGAQRAGDTVRICFEFTPFLDAGDYLISVGIASETPTGIIPNDRRYDSIKFRVAHPLLPTGGVAMNPSFRILDSKRSVQSSS